MVQPILLLDDDADLLNMLERVLEHDGFTIVTATSGERALEICEDERPCLVIADLMIPHMDGEAFLKEVARRFGVAAPPVAIMSGSTRCDEIAKQHGVVAAIAKPFDIDEVRSIANKYGAAGRSQPPKQAAS